MVHAGMHHQAGQGDLTGSPVSSGDHLPSTLEVRRVPWRGMTFVTVSSACFITRVESLKTTEPGLRARRAPDTRLCRQDDAASAHHSGSWGSRERDTTVRSLAFRVVRTTASWVLGEEVPLVYFREVEAAGTAVR